MSVLRHVPPELCFRKLRPGDVKRCMPTGPVFVGYWLCCPACGRTYWYLGDHVGWVESASWTKTEWKGVLREEDDDQESTRTVHHVTELSAAKNFPCYGCGRAISVTKNEMTVA